MTRFLAWSIDLACILGVISLISALLGFLRLISIEFAQAVTALLYFAVTLSYSMVLEWYWRGQTIGKRLLRLRVVDAQGLRLQASQIVIRNLLRFVDLLPLLYLVGGVACLVSRRGQRLGDLAANTIVVRNPKISQPDLDQLLSGKYNSLREYAHLEARLRQRVSANEASLAMQSLLRRDLLDPTARVELFREIADHFRAKVQFPAEASEGITDEQYVRNVVDVLFRTRTNAKPAPKRALPVYERG